MKLYKKFCFTYLFIKEILINFRKNYILIYKLQYLRLLNKWPLHLLLVKLILYPPSCVYYYLVNFLTLFLVFQLFI